LFRIDVIIRNFINQLANKLINYARYNIFSFYTLIFLLKHIILLVKKIIIGG